MKFGLVYCLQAPQREQLGQLYRDFLEQGLLAEKTGYDNVLVCEHHFTDDGYFSKPLSCITGLAALTQKIRVGTGVLLLPLYNPVHLAEEAATIDVMSSGRLILGVGQGYRQEEFDAFGIPLNERWSRLEEGTKIIRGLWSQESFSFSGRHFKLPSVNLTPKPVQKPTPPIWVAAKSENAVRRAARIGDAWFADPVTPLTILKDRYHAYRDALKKIGKDFVKIERPLFREAYVSKDRDSAWEESKKHVLYIYEHYYAWGHLLDEQGKAVKPGESSYEEFVDKLQKRFIMGSPDDCIAEIEKYKKELDVTQIIYRVAFPAMSHKKIMEAIKLFAEKVNPYFSGAS